MDSVTHVRGDSKRPTRDDRVKELRKTIETSVETLAQALDEVRASETFRAYLDVQARFHNYSWGNSLLILSQFPTATQVAGYRTWQKIGRQVRKGEHGITIFAPCPWKRENKETGEEESGMFFRAVHVFDVSQTDGDELPTVEVPDVQTAADSLLTDLVRVAKHRGITLQFGKIECGAYGVSKKGTIEIDDSHTTGQQAKTLAHELAHEAMHWEDRGELTRAIAELEAEAVAYVVCRHFNLDVEVRSSRYIALWQGDAKSLRGSLERIANTAREIIDETETVGKASVAA